MTTLIVKPGTSKGYVVLVPSANSAVPKITLSNGQVIYGKFLNDNEGRKQYVFPTTLYNESDMILDVGGKTQKLKNGKQSYEGSDVGSLAERAKGSIGEDGTVIGGLAGAQGVGGFGVAPQDISGEFPTAVTTSYDPIDAASYKFTDPQEFIKGFGEFNRGELTKNSAFSKNLALDAIDTELKALQAFAPAAAALKRSETSIDNVFNQNERTTQVNSAIPDVVKDLNQQASDARSYASGQAPNSVVDAALELGVRSNAADIAASSGFGASSSVARKLSNLQSAETRIGLSKYGNDLLSQNAKTRADLFLAPTSYSDAGAQLRVTPTQSGSQLQQSIFQDTNNKTIVSGETALNNVVQQNQFTTNIEQQTNQFNATNTLQNDQFNATTLNNFAQSLFNYKVGLSNAVAAAAQTSINTQVGFDQQDAARDEASKQKGKTQKGNTISSGIQAGATIVGAAIGFSDRSLKEDIELIHTNSRGVSFYSYKYKKGTIAEDDGRTHYGVIAQEVLSIYPDVVLVHASGALQVDYSRLGEHGNFL